MAVKIQGVKKGSSAERHHIQAGDILLAINGHEIMDVLDYRFYEIDRVLCLSIQGPDGKQREVKLRKPEYDEIGLEFSSYLMDEQHRCRNNCIFCFIDQMPPGLRDTLYFKDDDSRLSFLFGNYVTLTNLSEHEIERIIHMHISPINISVHTTNPELRVRMMNNRFAGEALQIMERFAQAGIQMNCQLVLCPGINDGEELQRTLQDLEQLAPAVGCIAVVPVGLTKYRQGLYPLRPYTPEEASAVIDLIENFAVLCQEKHGSRMVYAADEFYLKAGRKIPQAEYYEEFAQLENGVGLVALLREEFYAALDQAALEQDNNGCASIRITMATGVSAFPFLQTFLQDAKKRFAWLTGEVIAIQNNFFGENITVAGLITGRDLIDQLKGRDLGDALLIPSVMLRQEGDVFLDDVTVEELSQALAVTVVPVDNDGDALLHAMLGRA